LNQFSKDLFTVLSCLDYDTVYRVFVIGQDPRCPSNAVTFGDGQDNALNIFFAVIRMHKDSPTILREPLVARLTAKQQCPVFAIASTRRYVPPSPDFIVRTLGIGTKIIAEIHVRPSSHPQFSPLYRREAGMARKINNDKGTLPEILDAQFMRGWEM
jgi:hypothetical protein